MHSTECLNSTELETFHLQIKIFTSYFPLSGCCCQELNYMVVLLICIIEFVPEKWN